MGYRDIKHFEEEYLESKGDSALGVAQGVSSQPIVNPHFVRKARRKHTTAEYVDGILSRDVIMLSQAITIVESLNPAHHAQAQEIIAACLPHAINSTRIGITGVPGAGKSSFIEAVGGYVTSLGHRLAVLAIDPSSQRSGGSILGDKTRMESISTNDDIFIRPSPSAGELGGVARKTRETIVLCEAAGYDTIFIETVGVGQSETTVHSMVDIFLMLQISGAGDELQGIKRGIMEMSDMMVITKADGDNRTRAAVTRSQYQNALTIFPLPESGIRPKVYTCSALDGSGLHEVWQGVEDFIAATRENGHFERNRHTQLKFSMRESINETLLSQFYNNQEISTTLPKLEQEVYEQRLSPYVAAKMLLDMMNK